MDPITLAGALPAFVISNHLFIMNQFKKIKLRNAGEPVTSHRQQRQQRRQEQQQVQLPSLIDMVRTKVKYAPLDQLAKNRLGRYGN